MKKYILGGIFGILVVVPTVTFGGSFVSSLIRGRTPSEAVAVMGEQMSQLFGRVSSLEQSNQEMDEQITELQEKAETENEVAVTATSTSSVCLNLEKDIPKIGGYSYGTATTLPKLYASIKTSVESGKFYTLSSAQKDLGVRMVWDLKPKYENYRKYCGGPEFDITLPAEKQAYCESLDTQLRVVIKKEQKVRADEKDHSLMTPQERLAAQKEKSKMTQKERNAQTVLENDKQKTIEDEMNRNLCGFSYEVMPG